MTLEQLIKTFEHKNVQLAKIIKQRIGELSKKHNSITDAGDIKSVFSGIMEKFPWPTEEIIYNWSTDAYLYGNMKLGDDCQRKYFELLLARNEFENARDTESIVNTFSKFYDTHDAFWNKCAEISKFVKDQIGKKLNYIA